MPRDFVAGNSWAFFGHGYFSPGVHDGSLFLASGLSGPWSWKPSTGSVQDRVRPAKLPTGEVAA